MLAGERPEREAARKGGDAERPMEGEDPKAQAPESIRRWLRAYAELEALESELLDVLAARAANMGKDALHEAEETNLPVLLSQLERFRKRGEYWRQRAFELETRPTK